MLSDVIANSGMVSAESASEPGGRIVGRFEFLEAIAGWNGEGVAEVFGGGGGDLCGVEQFGGICAGDSAEEDSVGDAGDEVADAVEADQGRQGGAEGKIGLEIDGGTGSAAIFGGLPSETVGVVTEVDGVDAGGGCLGGVGHRVGDGFGCGFAGWRIHFECRVIPVLT